MDWDTVIAYADEEREFWLCDEQFFWSNAGLDFSYRWMTAEIVWS